MKKLINNIKTWINDKLNKFAVNRFKLISPAYSVLITELYRKIAKDSLRIDIKIIEVKKGKIRYKLLILKDKDLKTVYNLGRYHTDEYPVKSKCDDHEKNVVRV